MLKVEHIKKAHNNIKNFAKYTPILYSEALKKDIGLELMLKAENLQTTNSFKIRGASNCLMKTMASRPNLKGVIAASSGNHGQAVAYVAYKLGLSAIIVMPKTAAKAKINAVQRWDAKIEFCGTTSKERLDRAQKLAKDKGYFEVAPYDHYDVIAGQGTIGKEILEQLPEVDIVLIPIGGGGLIAGISTFIKNVKPKVLVIGVEPEASNSMGASLKKGDITRLNKTNSLADGLLSLEPGALTFPLVKEYVDKVMSVSEPEILNAVAKCIEYYKVFPEPSGAVSIAAALKGNWNKNKKVISIVSGGNYDIENMRAYMPNILPGILPNKMVE